MSSEELSLYLAAESISPIDDPFALNGKQNYWTAVAGGIKCKLEDFIPELKENRPLDTWEDFRRKTN